LARSFPEAPPRPVGEYRYFDPGTRIRIGNARRTDTAACILLGLKRSSPARSCHTVAGLASCVLRSLNPFVSAP